MTTDISPMSDFDDLDTGLEDFDSSRVTMPRLNIVHRDGVFENGQTSEKFSLVTGIALGMVKQRAMFHKEMGKEKLKPQCKSTDAQTGYPTMEGNTKDLFPWDKVAFTPNDLDKDEYGRPQIACATCPFAQWGPNRTPPPCAERHAYPILFSDAEDFKPGDEMPHRGIITFQKSGIKPSNTYLSSFRSGGTPLYGAYTRISLRREETGTVVYSVPRFARVGSTDQDDWRSYSDEYRALREYLRQPPRPPEGAERTEAEPARSATVSGAVLDEERVAAAAAPAPAAAKAAPAAAAPSFDDDDELPF